jgi:dipeptidyl aminopeptidase/acylaminoacyl peptidase
MNDGLVRTAAPEPRTRRRWPRRLAVGVVIVAALVVVGYFGIGYYAWANNTAVPTGCGTRPFATSTPADFAVIRQPDKRPVDASPYRFTDFKEVAFPTRDGTLTVRGWYAAGAADAATPTVILVHGRASCRRDPNILLPAGMLHRAGFGVLLIDLRNHGDSDVDDGRWAGGSKEFDDALGAWDWLVSTGHDPRTIGLFGASLGGATVTIATGEEPRVAATWADSSPADIDQATAEYAESLGYPGWVATPATVMGRLIGEPTLATKSPSREVQGLAGRPFFIVHGLADTTVLPHHAVDLAEAAYLGGTSVEPWLVPGSAHTQEVFDEPDRYEARLLAFFSGAIGTP